MLDDVVFPVGDWVTLLDAFPHITQLEFKGTDEDLHFQSLELLEALQLPSPGSEDGVVCPKVKDLFLIPERCNSEWDETVECIPNIRIEGRARSMRVHILERD